MKIFSFLILYLCFPCVMFSQGNILHFDTTNGLPHDITYGIFQDKEGYIWIGTDDGLAKFDGQEFKVFTTDDGFRNNFIIDINQIKNGDIVVATWGGGLHFIRNDKVISVKINNDETEKINNLQVWGNNIIVRDFDGNLVYEKTKNGYTKCLVDIENGSLKKHKISIALMKKYITIIDDKAFFLNSIKSIYQMSAKNEKGIFVYKNGKSKRFVNYFEDKVVNSISKVNTNEYLVSIKDSLFFIKNEQIFKKAKIPFDDSSNIIFEVEKINHNQYLILASDAKGFKNAYLFSNDFKTKLNLKKFLGIKASISDFIIDNEKNIWITTNGEGVFCYNPNTSAFNNIGKGKLPETLVLGIEELYGEKYILLPNHIVSFENYKTLKSLKLNGIGKKMRLLNNKINIISTNINKSYSLGKNIDEIGGFNSFLVPNYSNIFINDFIYFEKDEKKIPLNKRVLNDAVFYKDTLWFATNLGMLYYDKKVNNLVKKTINGKKLLSDNVRKLLLDKNKLWIATNKGLSKIEDNKIVHFTKKDGLLSNQINTIIKDHNNKLWIGTNKGLSVYDQKNFINITTNRGLLSPFINVIFESSTNEILVGSDKGVTIIDNNFPLKLETPPIINVTQNNTIFNYAIISYNRSNSLIAEYNLNNQGWINLEKTKGELNLENQKKGNHSLQFRAKKQDGNWGYSKHYNFKITIPWHKDVYYISLAVIMISLAIIFLILAQLRKVKKRNNDLKLAMIRQNQLENELSEVRTNIAQDFHDDLGNKLARISLLSNMAKEEVSAENLKLKSRIEQIESDANYLYKGTKDFIFSLNDESNYLEELVTYLSDFGEEFFRETQLKFIVEKNISHNIKLPYYWNKQLIYIFKEALTNAYKHAQADKVIVSFEYVENILIICCQDNGIGIKKNESKASNGISNMTKRAEKLGGKLEIDFKENLGTTITFKAKTTL